MGDYVFDEYIYMVDFCIFYVSTLDSRFRGNDRKRNKGIEKYYGLRQDKKPSAGKW